MILHLVDKNPNVVESWQDAFAGIPGVDFCCDDILNVARNCLVSPANSYGYMDGGIDLVYCTFFGPNIQRRVVDEISRRPEGLLPVGASLLVRTGHHLIPYLIVAPTMELPVAVSASNSYRAMVAILRVASQYPEKITDVYCPGLATGIGQVSPSEAAAEIAAALVDWNQRKQST
jgi:O-acetyl-ADP-ribose deacetylase (regulator of RNase III)